MTKGGGRRLGWGRILAAYLLVLQAALSGLALGATPVAADTFTILCDSATADPGSTQENGRAALPSCCLVSCLTHAGGMAPPPGFASAPSEPPADATEAAPDRADIAPFQAERTSRSARAPPARS